MHCVQDVERFHKLGLGRRRVVHPERREQRSRESGDTAGEGMGLEEYQRYKGAARVGKVEGRIGRAGCDKGSDGGAADEKRVPNYGEGMDSWRATPDKIGPELGGGKKCSAA